MKNKNIFVKNVCDNALTQENGLKLKEEILKHFDDNDEVILDFEGITKYVTLFFNNSIGYFILNFSPSDFHNKIKITNINELGRSVYNFSVNNAIKIYNDRLSKEQSDKISDISEKNINNL